MKIVISESQYQRLIEAEEEQKVLNIPSLKFFNNNWFLLQEFLERKGNPPYSFGENLALTGTPIKSLGNLQSVVGFLDLRGTSIESLGNLQSVGGYLDLTGTQIKSLGNLRSVGGELDLRNTPIESLGNLQFVCGNLLLTKTPLYKMYSEKQIRKMVNVEGNILI